MNHPLRLQRKRTKGSKLPPGTVCTNRPGRFGNPFATAAEFRKWLEGEIDPPELSDRRRWILDNVSGLRGKRLACFCKLDAACHADVLAELANGQ
jgi:hypothetical protein